MSRFLVLSLILVISPSLSSAKDATQLCPKTIKFLKNPLPTTADLYHDVMAGVLADLKRDKEFEGISQAEEFCRDARARLWTKLIAGASQEILKTPRILLIVGEYNFYFKKYDAARDAFFEVHRGDPNNIYVALMLAKIAELTFQREAQRAYLEVALQKISTDPKVIPFQQEAFLDFANMSPRSEALVFIRKTWAKAFPGDHRRALAVLKIGENSRDDKLLAEGVDLLGRLAPDAKTSSLVFFFRGYQYFIKRDFPRAQADLQTFLRETLREESRDLQALTMLLDAAQINKDVLSIKFWTEWGLEKGWLKDPRYLQMHESSVRIEDHPGLEGFKALKKSLSFHKKSLPIEWALAKRGILLVTEGKLLLTQASIVVDNLEMDYPESPEASFFRAKYLQLKKRFSPAQIYFNKARSRLESGAVFLDQAVRDEFLYAGGKNLYSIGKHDAAKNWIDWSLKFSELNESQKFELQNLQKQTGQRKDIF
jgi:tetratricopeptide (TPR) repeat protein